MDSHRQWASDAIELGGAGQPPKPRRTTVEAWIFNEGETKWGFLGVEKSKGGISVCEQWHTQKLHGCHIELPYHARMRSVPTR